MNRRTINLSDQWPFGLLTIRTYGTIFRPMTLRTTNLSDYWPFGPAHDFRTNEPSDQRPFGISSCPPLLMGTQIGGMNLRPRDKATERPMQYMFRSRGFPWISSEITRTIFFDLPIWDSNSSSFSCRSFSSQREPTVVDSIIDDFECK